MNAIIAALLCYVILLILLLAVIFIVLWRLIMTLTEKIDELADLLRDFRFDTENYEKMQNATTNEHAQQINAISRSLEHLVDKLHAALTPTAPSKPPSRKNTKEK